MRTFIAAMQVSLDGYVQGPDGEMADWVDSWADALGLLPPVDAFVLGRGMFDGRYEGYWDGALADPESAAEMYGRPPYPREVEYARFAHETPHVVLSKTMTTATWPNVRIVPEVDDIAAFKQESDGTAYVAGGPGLVATLIGAGLLDELRLIVQPVILGGGLPLFAGVKERHGLELISAEPGDGGRVDVSYRIV